MKILKSVGFLIVFLFSAISIMINGVTNHNIYYCIVGMIIAFLGGVFIYTINKYDN